MDLTAGPRLQAGRVGVTRIQDSGGPAELLLDAGWYRDHRRSPRRPARARARSQVRMIGTI